MTVWTAQKWNNDRGAFVNPTLAEINASTNSIGYKNSVNNSALCGYADWRLPTTDELKGILANSGSPRIDTTWFPNTQATYYWSSSTYLDDSFHAWSVDFSSGYVNSYSRVNDYLCSAGAVSTRRDVYQ